MLRPFRRAAPVRRCRRARACTRRAALDRRREQVGRADEAGDEGSRRALVDLGRRADLLDPPVVEDGDPVAHRERLLLVVRDVQEGDPDRLLDVLELDLHLLAQLQVERAERLVEQQHARPVDERARQRDALTLAAGELARLALAEVGEPHHAERLLGAAAALGAWHALDAQAVLDVLLHAHVREQRVVLEDRVDVPVVGRAPGHVDAAEQDAPRARQLEAGDHAQAGRLARARRPEHREELAAAHVEVDARDRGDVAEALDDPLEPHVELRPVVGAGRGASSPSCPWPSSPFVRWAPPTIAHELSARGIAGTPARVPETHEHRYHGYHDHRGREPEGARAERDRGPW